jgi:hypothetical protein
MQTMTRKVKRLWRVGLIEAGIRVDRKVYFVSCQIKKLVWPALPSHFR